MKRQMIYILVLIMFYFIFPIEATIAEVGQDTIDRVAQLTDVTGDVFVKRGGGLREFPAYNGMSLLEGDFVSTHFDSSATIIFDQDQTILGEHTQVYLARLSNQEDIKETALSQWSGQTWNKVKSLLNADDTYEIETATSIMGVRGTLFTVMINPEIGKESLIVIEGKVENQSTREYRADEVGRVVSVSEQLDINLANKEREENAIDYDDLVEQLDKRIVAAIYYDVLERADHVFDEHAHSAFEGAEKEMTRLLLSIQSDMMLESLVDLTNAIKRANEEKRVQIEAQLQQRMELNLSTLEQQIFEKRLRQIEQYEALKERALSNGISEDMLAAFIEEHGGVASLERMQQIEGIKNSLQEWFENVENQVIDRSGQRSSVDIIQIDQSNQTRNPLEPEEREVTHETSSPIGKDHLDEKNLQPETEVPIKEESPPEVDDELAEEGTPSDEEEPTEEESPSDDEEDPTDEEPPLEDDDDPGMIVPEVNQLAPSYLKFGSLVEEKSIGDFLVDDDQIEFYQFTGSATYDANMIEVIFTQDQTSFSIRGKTEGATEVAVQLIDYDGQMEPVTVTFTVYVENILPDLVDIPEEYRDQLMMGYEHGTNRLYISIKDDLTGFLNGWLVNGRSIWPTTDSQDGLAEQLSCSGDILTGQIPRQLCLDSDLLASFEGEGLSIVPIIDPFEIKVENPTDQANFIVRDFDQNGHTIVTAFANESSDLKTWQVTYAKNGVVRTDDFRADLIAIEMDQQSDSIFNRLLECTNEQDPQYGIPGQLCLSDPEGILAITAVFSHSHNQELIIDNEKNVPLNIQYLLDGTIVKLSVTEERELVSRLFEINSQSKTTIVEHPENPMEFYLYSDEAIHVSVDFIEVPVEIILADSEPNQGEHVGSIEQLIDFEDWGGMYYLDFWLIAEPADGYRFTNWLIYWGEDDTEPMEHYSEELMMAEFMYSDVEVIVKAVFEVN